MKKRAIAKSLGTILLGLIVFSSCQKINEATDLGSDLIPPIDNINTFDTILTVQAFNDTFEAPEDSIFHARAEEHFLGLINNDPIFGKTDARVMVELKPANYGRYPFGRKDSLLIDSIVLVLNYVESYGDTTIPQTVNVYEMDQSNNFTIDSAYILRANFIYPAITNPAPLGTGTFIPSTLNDSIKAFQDTTNNQLRIKLDTNFARRLFNYDTTNAYKNDSIFKSLFKGFAIQSMSSGNAIVGLNLGGANTKLAFYYRQPKKTGTLDSSTVSYFNFTALSAAANPISRDYAGTPLAASVGPSDPNPDPIIYLQNSPGNFANIFIPDLGTLSNRVVHRAELIVEQLSDPSDALFPAPDYLYLDAYDASIQDLRTIPYDVNIDVSGVINFTSFGAVPVNSVDGSGNKVKVWHFNISRYLQHVVTKTVPLYTFRLIAPFYVIEKYGLPPDVSTDATRTLFVNPAVAKGRVRLAGNTGSGDSNPQRIRLRIVYSKI